MTVAWAGQSLVALVNALAPWPLGELPQCGKRAPGGEKLWCQRRLGHTNAKHWRDREHASGTWRW